MATPLLLLALLAAADPAAVPPHVDPRADPVLALAEPDAGDPGFLMMVAKAVDRHPGVDEAVAGTAEAKAARIEARSALFPTADLSATTYRVVARDFDPTNVNTIYENSRAHTRSDLTASINQTVFDFGATSKRISAATARLRAAAANVDDAADRIALAMISAWYDVYTYRALVALADRQVEKERSLRGDVEARVRQGYSAQADVLRVDSAIAATRARAAGYRRQLANAEARFLELSGEPPPSELRRAPSAAARFVSLDAVRAAADTRPSVLAIIAQADAARRDAQAARADRLPNLTASIEAGRYGVLENQPDYDVRGVVTLRQRLSGAVFARAREVDARAVEAQARADRVRQEAERDAATAWTDVAAIDSQVSAEQASYVAARDASAMLAERFRYSRGTLFDVLSADDAEFAAAAAYVEGIGDRDAARYVLLSRTGTLIDALGIDMRLVSRRAGSERSAR